MAKRAKVQWSDTPEGEAWYEAARADAQERANRTGFDHGIEANNLMRHWHVFMLPRRENRAGRELQCEVVLPERLESCKPGHGPMAGR